MEGSRRNDARLKMKRPALNISITPPAKDNNTQGPQAAI